MPPPVACPSCGREVAIKDARPGRFRVNCPGCDRPFLVEVGEGPDPEVVARPQANGPGPTAVGPWDAAREELATLGRTLLRRSRGLARALTHPRSLVGGALIETELGRTSVGSVSLGRHLLTGRDVLVRLLPSDWGGADVASLAAASRMEYLTREVVHPNLARRYSLASDRSRRFTVEEPPPGPTLAARACRDDWTEADALAAVLHVARGLSAAHDHGVVHGDPNPELIAVGDDGSVTLAGLGLVSGLGDRTGGEPTLPASSVATDVNNLGFTLHTSRGPRLNPVNVSDAIVDRLKRAGQPGGYRDLAEAIRGIEDALTARGGGTIGPTAEEGDRFGAAAAQLRSVPLAAIRDRVAWGALGVGALFALLALTGGNLTLFGEVVGLLILTTLALAAIRSATSAAGQGPGLGGRAREWLFGGRRSDWLTVGAVGALTIVVAIALGWWAGGIALGLVSVTLALAFHVALDVPIRRDEADTRAEALALVAGLRRRGVAELAIREMARRRGGPALYESIFGLDEAARVRNEFGAARPRFRLVGRRFAALRWLDARLADREEARARERFEPIEERALVARKVNEMTARRKSRRIAEALVTVGREVRASSLAALDPPGDAIRVVPRPIPDLIREAVETPDRLLTSTYSDARDESRGPNPLLRVLAALVGPRARFLAGGVLVAAFLLWADQVGIISSREIRETVEQAARARDVEALRGVNFDLERARQADEPLRLPGVSSAITRPISGYGVGAAGLILLASSLGSGWAVAPFAIVGAGIAWFGPRLGIPAVGPLEAPALASAIGAAVLAVGAGIVGRR